MSAQRPPLQGRRPGAHDVPAARHTALAEEAPSQLAERNRRARQANPAYGKLNLAVWSERVTHGKSPGGRARKTQ